MDQLSAAAAPAHHDVIIVGSGVSLGGVTITRRQSFTGLAAIGLASGILSSRANAMSGSKIVSDAIASAKWIAEALSSSGYLANFSLESLIEIDRFFEDHAPNGTPRPDGLLSEQVGSRLFAIGSYVGETLRQRLGGEWVGDDNDPQAEINISIKLSDGSIIWPIQRVMKRFKNGREDSIAAYGAALASPNK